MNGLELRVYHSDLDQGWDLGVAMNEALQVAERIHNLIFGRWNERSIGKSAPSVADPVLAGPYLAWVSLLPTNVMKELLVDLLYKTEWRREAP